MRAALQRAIQDKGLQGHVTLCGALPYEEVDAHYKDWAQLFLFTGKIARSGDRDGFPNVIGEAMAAGVIILATAVAGIPEVIQSSQTGILVELGATKQWSHTIRHLRADHAYQEKLRTNAHSWVRQYFDGSLNAQKLLKEFKAPFSRRSETPQISGQGPHPYGARKWKCG